MSAENGKLVGADLNGFVLALVGKLTLIGKLHEKSDTWGECLPRRLSPVYQLDVYVIRKPLQPEQMGLGEIAGFLRECMPLLTFSSIESFPIGDVPVFPISELSREEQRVLSDCVAGCQDFMVKARAAEVGVTLETNIPANARELALRHGKS